MDLIFEFYVRKSENVNGSSQMSLIVLETNMAILIFH